MSPFHPFGSSWCLSPGTTTLYRYEPSWYSTITVDILISPYAIWKMECFTIRLNVVQLQGELKHAHVHTVIQQQIKDLICCSTVQLTNFILSFSTAAQEALNNLEDYDKTCLESALQGVSNIVQQEWGCTCPCQVVCFLLSTWRDEHHSSYNIPSIGV